MTPNGGSSYHWPVDEGPPMRLSELAAQVTELRHRAYEEHSLYAPTSVFQARFGAFNEVLRLMGRPSYSLIEYGKKVKT